LNRGHHLYSAGRPSGWALAHILVRLNLICDNYIVIHQLLSLQWLLALNSYHKDKIYFQTVFRGK